MVIESATSFLQSGMKSSIGEARRKNTVVLRFAQNDEAQKRTTEVPLQGDNKKAKARQKQKQVLRLPAQDDQQKTKNKKQKTKSKSKKQKQKQKAKAKAKAKARSVASPFGLRSCLRQSGGRFAAG
jgi:hypothetical protein